MNMIYTGMRRRKKEIRYVSIVTFISAFFVAGILLFQTIMNDYIMERNYENYGNWILSTSQEPLVHPYLSREGIIRTGSEITDGEGNLLNLQIGSLDDGIKDFGRIGLYEGRFPENDNEIAANLYALARLGVSYELGQDITIFWIVQPADPKTGQEAVIETETYTLTGTLKPFASVWYSQEYSLPELIVTEEKLCTFPQNHAIRFYELDPSLTKLDPSAFADAMQKEQKAVVYNSYVYENQIWGNKAVFDRVVLIMVGIAVTAIAFLLCSYTAQRRDVYYRYRSMGVSRRRLSAIIVCECGIASVPFAVLGLAAAYAVGVFGCMAASAVLGVQNFFCFDKTNFGYQAAAIAATLFLSILTAVISCGDKRLAAGMNAIPDKKIPMLHKMAKRSKRHETALFRRQNALHPVLRVLSVLSSVCAAAFLVLCTKQIAVSVLDQIPLYQKISDSFILAATQVPLGGSSPYCGLGKEDLAYLSELYGVGRIEAEIDDIEDSIHIITWTGMEDSEWIQALRARGIQIQNMTRFRYYKERIGGKQTLDTIAQAYSSRLSQEEYESWLKGELLVLVLNTAVLDYRTGEEIVYEDDTLKNKDMVLVSSTEYLDGLLQVPVIVLHTNSFEDEVSSLYKNGGSDYIYALASEQFLEKLSVLEKSEVRINAVNLYFNSFASYEATDKMVAEFISEKGFYYFDQSESKRLLLQEKIIRPIAVSGSLFLMTLFLYLVLERSFTDAKAVNRRESIRLLKQIGMTDRRLSRMLIKESICRYAWLFGGLPVGCAMIYYQIYNSESARLLSEEPGMTYYLGLINGLSSDRLLYSLDQLLFNSYIQWLFVVLAVLFVFSVWFCWYNTRKILKSEGIV